MRLGLALCALAACARPAPIASCADDLGGVYATPAGERWMILDNRGGARTLEIYPLFPDAAAVIAPPGVSVAPRVIDLAPSGDGLAGDVRRRFTLRGDHCDARAPAHVTQCKDAALELVVADPSAPLAYAPCRLPPTAPSRREVWTRD